MSGTIPLLDSDDAPEDLGAVAESSAPPQEGPVVAPPEAGPAQPGVGPAQPGVGPAQPGAEARPVESAPSAEPTTSADRKPEKDVAEEPVEPEPALSAEIESETAEKPVEEEAAEPGPAAEAKEQSVEPEPARPAEADATERTATAEAEGPAESAEEQDAEAVEASAEPEQPAESEPARPAETEPVESETAEKPVEAVVEEPAVEPEPEEPAKTQTAEEPAAVSDPAAPSPGAPTAVRTRKATTAGANVAHPPLRPRFSLSAPTPATAAESAAGADSADMPLPPSVPPVARTPERTRDERTSAEPAPDEQKKSEAAAPARRRRLPLILGAAAVLLVLIWGAIAFATTRHIFAGSTVSGVAVGNMSPAQAESAVSEAIGAQLGQPVTLVVGDATDMLVPAESGVSVDARASVERLTGFTLNPLTLVERLRGADVDAVTRVDVYSLTTALDARLNILAVGATNAGVTLNGTRPVLSPATTGTGLDVDSAVATLSENWPLGRETIELPNGEAKPAVTDEEAQTLIDKVLTPLLSGNLTITAEGTAADRALQPTVVLTPEQLAGLVRIGTTGGDITASLDPQGLREAVLAVMGPQIEAPAQDATWTIEGRADAKPVYVEAHGGTVVDADALAADALTAATQDDGAGDRRVALSVIYQTPTVTTPAADWGINQIIGEYSTPYYPDAARTQNLVAGTEAINGTVVMPGGQFSLTEALGQIDEEHGFASAGVVTNGQHTDAMGGGLSQVATTVFNAGFEAGMDDVEHTPHNYWFTRYPAGREATLWTGNLDVKFGNSTPTAVLVQAWAVDGEVHVRLWGTPYYRVSIDNGTPHNYRAYRTQRQSGANCVPYEGGAQGFDITVTRSRTKPDGQKLPDDVLTTSYDSDNPITCG
ncbi:VanW family protein [uncultured Actinomyces sp.]|uniref:VanW family protein n=2 Tax=uncultured Actinomyces sp. TaxID=249061 RepID=UPI00288944F6|nr:VanW family protein [uncultured Actinomyces sp.]